MVSLPSHFQLRPSIIQNTINLQKTHTCLSQRLQPLTKQAVFLAFCEHDVEPPAYLQWREETVISALCDITEGWSPGVCLSSYFLQTTVMIDCVCCGSVLPDFNYLETVGLNFIDLELGGYTVTATKNITK